MEKSLGGLVKSPPFYAKAEIARLRKELTLARLREAGLSMTSEKLQAKLTNGCATSSGLCEQAQHIVHLWWGPPPVPPQFSVTTVVGFPDPLTVILMSPQPCWVLGPTSPPKPALLRAALMAFHPSSTVNS